MTDLPAILSLTKRHEGQNVGRYVRAILGLEQRSSLAVRWERVMSQAMTRNPSLLQRTDWSDLPRIIAAGLAVGGTVALVLRAFG